MVSKFLFAVWFYKNLNYIMRLCATCNNFLIRVLELYYSQYERSNFKEKTLKLLNIELKLYLFYTLSKAPSHL